MRWLRAPIASLVVLLVLASGSQAAAPKVPSILKGSATGETVISSAPPYTPQTGRTTWTIKGLKLELYYYFAGENGDMRAVYRITAGTVTLDHVANGQCSYSASAVGKLRDLVAGKPSGAIIGFSRAKGRSTLDAVVELDDLEDVQYSCVYSPGAPPVVTIDEVLLPELFQIVPRFAKLKLTRRMKLNYTHQSTKYGSTLKIDWSLQLKGSKFTSRQRS